MNSVIPPTQSPSPKSALDVYEQRTTFPIEYPVVFEEDCLDPQSQAIAWAVSRKEPGTRHAVAIFCDSGFLASNPDFRQRLTAYLHAHRVQLDVRLACVEVEGGEACKNDSQLLERLHRLMVEAELDRHSTALVFGGGSVLDAVGYACGTFHRGMRIVRLPTTVLAQNDAGVGVKNGVNSLGIKNLAGTFAPPHAVINDVSFLSTLTARDRRAGLAEAVKVALIRDAEFFSWLRQNARALSDFESDAVKYMVRRTAALHLAHIAQGGDPFELGSSRPLDFGHWSAHKLESLSQYGLRHGEAVAIGIALDSLYSHFAGMLEERELEAILSLLSDLGFCLNHPCLHQETEGKLEVLRGLEEFRQHLGGRLTITLLNGSGRPIEVQSLDEQLVARAVRTVGQRFGQ